MELLTSPSAVAVDLLPQLSTTLCATRAANDPGANTYGSDDKVRDVNLLVAEVAGRVAAHVQSAKVDIELDLQPNVPEIEGDASLLGFVVAGVLVNQLRALEGADDGVIRIKTEVRRREVKISILANGVPLLGAVRALENDRESADPTMAHCCRLIEALGGWISLRDEYGFLGFTLNLPSFPRVCGGRVLPLTPRDEHDVTALAA